MVHIWKIRPIRMKSSEEFQIIKDKKIPRQLAGDFSNLNRPYKNIFWFTHFISSARIV